MKVEILRIQSLLMREATVEEVAELEDVMFGGFGLQ
jgi:hypothetical protein